MNRAREPGRKYYSISEYIDIETGEILTAYEAQNKYEKIKYEKSYESDDRKTITKYQYQCRRIGEQLELELD
jgi:hypothetical protein